MGFNDWWENHDTNIRICLCTRVFPFDLLFSFVSETSKAEISQTRAKSCSKIRENLRRVMLFQLERIQMSQKLNFGPPLDDFGVPGRKSYIADENHQSDKILHSDIRKLQRAELLKTGVLNNSNNVNATKYGRRTARGPQIVGQLGHGG